MNEWLIALIVIGVLFLVGIVSYYILDLFQCSADQKAKGLCI